MDREMRRQYTVLVDFLGHILGPDYEVALHELKDDSNEIIAIASPILSVVYPPTLVLIVPALFGSRIRRDWVFRLAALGALAVSLLEVVRTYTGVELAFLDLLPLASLDFGWVLPAAVCGAVGALIPGGRTAAS